MQKQIRTVDAFDFDVVTLLQPLQGEASDASRAAIMVLNGKEIPGEMDIAGTVSVLRVRDDPPSSYAVETCAGSMVLDESWADDASLPTMLDSALQLLQRRVDSPLAVWAMAFR